MSVKYLLAALALLFLAAGLFVRLNPLDSRALHVDPETVEPPSVPGHVLLRPGGDIEPQLYETSPAELAARIEAIVLATPRTERLAGNLEQGFATYVTRSKLWGFPDIANVKIVPVEGGAELRILSRLRYGYADMGVNEKRLKTWIAALEAAL